jgi:hypothetical protein
VKAAETHAQIVADRVPVRNWRVLILGINAFHASLGIVYTDVTQWLGFPQYCDERKAIGLANTASRGS